MDQISWLAMKFIYSIITMNSFLNTWYLKNSCCQVAAVQKYLLRPLRLFQKFTAAFQLCLWAFLISSEKEKATVSLATLPDKSWQWAIGICSNVECSLLPNIKYWIFLFFGRDILGADSLAACSEIERKDYLSVTGH